MKSFQFVYNHEEIYEFVKNNIFASNSSTQSKPLSLILPSPQTLEKRRFSFGPSRDRDFKWLMSKIVVKAGAELWNLSMLTKLGDRKADLCISHTKCCFDQSNEKRTSVYKNKFLQMLLDSRHWSTELMIDSCWWTLDNATGETQNRKIHMRGSPIFLGLSLIKLSSYGNATKLDVSVHTLRLEYSQCLAEFLLKLKQCYCQYGLNDSYMRRSVLVERSNCIESEVELIENDATRSTPLILINVEITNFTTFLFTNYAACILIDVSKLLLARSQSLTVVKLDEVHMAVQNGVKKSIASSLVDLADFHEIFLNLKTVRIEYLVKQRSKGFKNRQFNIYIIDDTVAIWNANLHMQWLKLVQDFLTFKNELCPLASPLEAHYSSATNSSDDEKSSIERSRTVFEIYAENHFEFGIKISERHSMGIFFENFFIGIKEQTILSIDKIFINIDDAPIFTIKDYTMQSATSLNFLQAERSNYENLVLPTNKVWITTIGAFNAIFPYDHDFAEAIQNEFNSTVKWLKTIHGRTSKPFSNNSPLPSDMVIQVKEFLFEMSDDPFEVKLRDNYVLLVDEYNESIKRQQLFDQKIKVLRAAKPLLPDDKFTEAQNDLIRKNSEIYIQRSKRIREAGPTRTRLFAWILTDLEIMAMADPSLHGYENVTQIMSEIDNESPWPEEDIEFVTLWCRAVNVSCSEWKFMLR